jgi:hypothetical protein
MRLPLVVLEAKSEDKNPLVGKEQARKYAKSQNCRFVILSNGNLHYFWDLEQGNPHIITRFPIARFDQGLSPLPAQPAALITEPVGKDYIALTQMPGYANEAGWNNAVSAMPSSRRTVCASCATTRSAPCRRSRTPSPKVRAASCSRWPPAPARR